MTEVERAYHVKLIADYEAFLAKPHPESFYTRAIKFPAGFERTNEAHCLALIESAKAQLARG